jgi:hypothetical protein
MTEQRDQSWWILVGCWVIATGASLGSLFFSEIMELPPCSMCWQDARPPRRRIGQSHSRPLPPARGVALAALLLGRITQGKRHVESAASEPRRKG